MGSEASKPQSLVRHSNRWRRKCKILDETETRTLSEKPTRSFDDKAVCSNIGNHELLFRQILDHHDHQQNAFDLVASNTVCSYQVRAIMGSALMDSCCIGLPGNRFYGGCSDIDLIEEKTRQLVCKVFGAPYCEVQLLSGMMANIAAYCVMLPSHGCCVMASPSKHGGHYSHNTNGPLTRFFGATVVQTPWNASNYNVDIDLLPQAMAEHKPSLLILGWSEMLFEHDLAAIRKICDRFDCKIMYDMSHVAGLIAGGVFQTDVVKYADIVTSSTGKTLQSVDHGLLLYKDPSLTPKIRQAVMPLLTSNTHFHEIAALCMTMLEMQTFGHAYARQVVANTQALGKELDRRGFKVLCSKLGYSRSHELIVDLGKSAHQQRQQQSGAGGGGGVQATRRLDAAGIFANPQDLPWDTAVSGPTGLRLGTQALTRRGFREQDMIPVADALAHVLHYHQDPSIIRNFVAQKCSEVNRLSFAFPLET